MKSNNFYTKCWQILNSDTKTCFELVRTFTGYHSKHYKPRTKKQRKSPGYNEYMKEYLKNYNIKNKERLKKYKQEWTQKNKERILNHKRNYYIENKERFSEYSKAKYQKDKFKIALRNRGKGKSGKKIPLDLQFAMNRVRIRDNNTCQWYGCGLQHKITEVHVHHIFPRNEYPELELIEQYMICYCAEHHAQFHAMRGDHYHKFIKNSRKIIIEKDIRCNEFIDEDNGD